MNDYERALIRYVVDGDIRNAQKQAKIILNKIATEKVDILPTAKAGGFLHQPPLHSNRGCCVLHDVRQALLPVCPTVRYVFIKRTFAQALYAKY